MAEGNGFPVTRWLTGSCAYQSWQSIMVSHRAVDQFVGRIGVHEGFLCKCCSEIKWILYLQAGCKVSHTDNEGNTALHLASSNGQLSILEALLKAGANPEACNHCGKTPLILAATYQHVKCVETLVRNGAYSQAKDWNGTSPLTCIVRRTYSQP